MSKYTLDLSPSFSPCPSFTSFLVSCSTSWHWGHQTARILFLIQFAIILRLWCIHTQQTKHPEVYLNDPIQHRRPDWARNSPQQISTCGTCFIKTVCAFLRGREGGNGIVSSWGEGCAQRWWRASLKAYERARKRERGRLLSKGQAFIRRTFGCECKQSTSLLCSSLSEFLYFFSLSCGCPKVWWSKRSVLSFTHTKTRSTQSLSHGPDSKLNQHVRSP